MSGRSAAAALAAALVLGPAPRASAEPYRLRADAFAAAPEAAGFLILEAEAREQSPLLVDTEALVWTGARVGADEEPEAAGEVVTASVRLRNAERWGEVRFGRVLFYNGAVRPIHFDGAIVSARAPTGAGIDVFGGIPAAPGWKGRSYDWLVGVRTTQAFGRVARFGYSYWEARDEGRPSKNELGFEASTVPHEIVAASASASVDPVRLGLVEARAAVTLHGRVDRLEVFGLRRSPSRMLPATSLFAALGSYDADALGASGFWRAFPRLDLSAAATVESIAERVAATQSLRAELRLDDEGRGVLGLEARRVSAPETSWTGLRAWARVPIVHELSTSTEIEVAVPDEQRGRGLAWPWGLFALTYRPLPYLEAAGGIEASASPTVAGSIGGVLRVSGKWGAP